MTSSMTAQSTVALGVHGHVAFELREFNAATKASVDAHNRKIATLKAVQAKAADDLELAYDRDLDAAPLHQALRTLHRKERAHRNRMPTMTARNTVVVRRGEWDNLILDSGLDLLATNSAAAVHTYCAVGTGNAVPTVSQQGLVSESARTSNYLTSGGGSGTTQPNNFTWVQKRTFDFPLAALNGTYAEVGFSPSGSVGANLYNRSLIQSSGVPTAVTVSSAQQLRVVFTHTISVSPLAITRNVPEINGMTTVTSSGATTASQTGTAVTSSTGIFTSGMINQAIKFANGVLAIITAFTNSQTVTVDRTQSVAAQTFSLLSGTEGADQIQSLSGLIGTVASNGTSVSTGAMEPSRSSIPGFVSASAIALPVTAGTGVDRSGSANTNGAYIAQTYTGGFKRDYKMAFSVNDANHVIRSFGLSNGATNNASVGTLVTLLDVDQAKTSLFTLDLVCELVWNRA